MKLPTGTSSPLRLRPGFFKGRVQFGQSLIFFASAAATVNEWPQLGNGQDNVTSAALPCFAWAVLGDFGGPFGLSGKRRGLI
jgi:hypothetical protein